MFAHNVDAKVQPFDGAHTEEHEVVRFRENHIVRRRKTGGVDDRVADVAFQVSSICHNESLSSLHLDVERFEHCPRDPCKLTSGIHQGFRKLPDSTQLRNVLNADSRAHGSHVRHYCLSESKLLYHYPSVVIAAMPDRPGP